MTQTDAPAEAEDVAQPIERLVAEALAAWKQEARDLAKLATAFGPLARSRAYEDLTKLPALLGKVEAKVGNFQVAARGAVVLAKIREEANERVQRMQARLAQDLQTECAELGLELRVVRREEPVEVRIPPFAVLIDRAKGRAELRFARQAVVSCEASAPAILKAHAQALDAMRKGFDADRFFDACVKAWRAARGGNGGEGERVELLDFLPHLALQMQPPAFRVDPTQGNFRGYSRARFAFDVLRLRNEGGLARRGWRLNLGVATGTTASKKNRVLFLEDEYGDGEYKLTVYCTRVESKP